MTTRKVRSGPSRGGERRAGGTPTSRGAGSAPFQPGPYPIPAAAQAAPAAGVGRGKVAAIPRATANAAEKGVPPPTRAEDAAGKRLHSLTRRSEVTITKKIVCGRARRWRSSTGASIPDQAQRGDGVGRTGRGAAAAAATKQAVTSSEGPGCRPGPRVRPWGGRAGARRSIFRVTGHEQRGR